MSWRFEGLSGAEKGRVQHLTLCEVEIELSCLVAKKEALSAALPLVTGDTIAYFFFFAPVWGILVDSMAWHDRGWCCCFFFSSTEELQKQVALSLRSVAAMLRVSRLRVLSVPGLIKSPRKERPSSFLPELCGENRGRHSLG